MHESFVLKHVTEPERIIMASKEATVLSFLTFPISMLFFGIFLSCFFRIGLGLLILIDFILSILVFLMVHAYMIYRTSQDPYFLNIWLAELRCKKPKNSIKTRDNHYGD